MPQVPWPQPVDPSGPDRPPRIIDDLEVRHTPDLQVLHDDPERAARAAAVTQPLPVLASAAVTEPIPVIDEAPTASAGLVSPAAAEALPVIEGLPLPEIAPPAAAPSEVSPFPTPSLRRRTPARPRRRWPLLALGLLLGVALGFAAGVTAPLSRMLPASVVLGAAEATARPVASAARRPIVSWATAAALTGRTDRTGRVFTLMGGTVRLTYTTRGGNESLTAFYVLPVGTTLIQEGAVPVVGPVVGRGHGQVELHLPRGRYYLAVMTGASYTVTVQEQR